MPCKVIRYQNTGGLGLTSDTANVTAKDERSEPVDSDIEAVSPADDSSQIRRSPYEPAHETSH